MASFEELMEQYRNPGEQGLPDNFADELTTAYQEDLSLRDAAVSEKDRVLQEKDTEVATHLAEINRLKAVNYDLLIAAPKAGTPANNQEPGDATEKRGIDSLFE